LWLLAEVPVLATDGKKNMAGLPDEGKKPGH
jgi:hypothetical protein